MTRNRKGVVSLFLLVGLVLAALVAGAQVSQSFKPAHASQGNALKDAGGAAGEALGGAPGRAVGENLGYLLALVLGVTAAHRHGAAAAATARLSERTSAPPTGK